MLVVDKSIPQGLTSRITKVLAAGFGCAVFPAAPVSLTATWSPPLDGDPSVLWESEPDMLAFEDLCLCLSVFMWEYLYVCCIYIHANTPGL